MRRAASEVGRTPLWAVRSRTASSTASTADGVAKVASGAKEEDALVRSSRFALHHSVSPFGHAECLSEEDNQSREQKRGDGYHNAVASLPSQGSQSVTPVERSPIERWDGEGLRFEGSGSLEVALRWLKGP